MSKVNLKGKKVLEIGAGDIKHNQFWKTKPAKYAIVDNLRSMLEKSISRIKEIGVPYEAEFIGNNEKFKLPFEDNSFDVFISFYNLEHLYPISNFTKEIVRVLNKDNATIAGAVPIEGGLAWGLGRYLTSRRWFKNNTKINPDKIICWEHPNFITDIKSDLDEQFSKIIYSKKWPLSKLPLAMNLIWKFIYKI